MGDITLNPEAIKIMDEYMEKRREPAFRGLERNCTAALRDIAESVFREKCVTRLVRIKEEPVIWTEWDYKYENYFDGGSFLNFVPWGYGRSRWGYRYFLYGKCAIFFGEHDKDIASAYTEKRWGNAENAIRNTTSFLGLCADYADWFDGRREKFMEDMSAAIAEVKKFQMSDKPQSHGGVANLLKTLTRTMEKRGADITSIAKVQYAVCVQAGIYIPDEFLQDVAVAMDILEDKEEQRGNTGKNSELPDNERTGRTED